MLFLCMKIFVPSLMVSHSSLVVTNHMKYGYEKNAIILDGHKRLGELSQYCREHYSKR